VSIRVNRKNKVGTAPIVSKSRRTQRRPVKAAMLLRHPFRVNAASFPRRQFLHLAAGAATLPGVSRIAEAQTYPTRPVRITVGFAAGGFTDIAARLMGQWLSERLGQQFIIENRTGANGTIAVDAVVRAPPDGYTLLLTIGPDAYSELLYPVRFKYIRDITPVAGIVRAPFVMAVNPSLPATTVREFIAYAKANLGKVNMAAAGIGSGNHLSGELFKIMAGVNMIPVPYRGEAPALADMLGGQVQVIFGTMPGMIEYIRSGRLRALAVTTATRSEALPDIPTVGDFVPGYESVVWAGVGVPKNTPAEIVEKLNKAINAGLADPKMKARFADLGAEPTLMTPAELGRLIGNETEKWGKVIRAANIKAQ
jgi:tripartite-type tricarboxylate transporter receptor subunit TctC